MSDPEPDDHHPDDPAPDYTAPLILPLPGLLWGVIVLLAGAEAAFWAGAQGLIGGAGAAGWRLQALEWVGYSAAAQAWMWENRQFPVEHLVRYFGYPLVHPGPAQAALSVVLLAALGKFTAQSYGRPALAVLLVVPPALGAAVFGALTPGQGWLMGALPTVLGLVGAWTLVRWHEAGQSPRARIAAFGLIGSFLLVRLVIGLLAEATDVWIADLAAFAIGFVLAIALRGGAARRALDRLRQR